MDSNFELEPCASFLIHSFVCAHERTVVHELLCHLFVQLRILIILTFFSLLFYPKEFYVLANCVHTIPMQCIRTDNAYNPEMQAQTNVKWRKPMLSVSVSGFESLPLPLPNEMPFAFDYNYYLVSPEMCSPFHPVPWKRSFYLHHLHRFLFLYNKYLTFAFTFVDTFNDEIVSFSIKMGRIQIGYSTLLMLDERIEWKFIQCFKKTRFLVSLFCCTASAVSHFCAEQHNCG